MWRTLLGFMRELINPNSLMPALHHVSALVSELEAGGQRFDDFATKQDNRIGIGIDNFAKGLEPLGRIHGVTDDRIVDSPCKPATRALRIVCCLPEVRGPETVTY